MKNAKKIMATILVINMCILLLGGCGKNDNSTASKPNYDNLSDYIDDYNEDEDDSSDGHASIPDELLIQFGLDERVNEWLDTDGSFEGFNAIYGEPSDRKKGQFAPGTYYYIYEDMNIRLETDSSDNLSDIICSDGYDIKHNYPESIDDAHSIYIVPDKELARSIVDSSYKVFKDAKNYDDFKQIMNGIVPQLSEIYPTSNRYKVVWWIILTYSSGEDYLVTFEAIFNASDNSVDRYSEWE